LRTHAYHLRRARYLRLAGRPADAEVEERLAQQRPADSAFDHFLVGQEQYNRAKLTAALLSFREANAQLRGKPGDDFWVWYYEALCHIRREDYESARICLTHCLAKKNEVVWPFLLRGFANGQLGRVSKDEIDRYFREAEDDFTTAGRLLDDNEDVSARYVLLNNRAVVRIGQKKAVEHQDTERARRLDQEVRNDLAAAVRLKPEQYQAFATLAQVHEMSGELDAAIEQMGRAIKLAAAQVNARTLDKETLALLYTTRGRWWVKRRYDSWWSKSFDDRALIQAGMDLRDAADLRHRDP